MLAADIEVLLMQYLIKKNIVDLIKKLYIILLISKILLL